MSLQATTLLFNVLFMFCQLNTMAIAVPSRFSRKNTIIFFNMVWLALAIFCLVLSLIFDPFTATYIFMLIYWLPQIIAGLFVAKKRNGQFWCIFFSCDIASVLTSTASYVIGSFFISVETATIEMLLIKFIGVIVGTAFAVFFLVPHFKQLLDVDGIPWGSLAMTVFMMDMMILMMVTYPEHIFYRFEERINLLVVCIMSAIILSMLLISLNRVKLSAEQAQKLEEQLALSERYYAELTAQLQENRIHLHDLRYHINTLSGLCAQQDIQGITNYVSTMKNNVPVISQKHYCVINAVNALLSHYENICQEKGISMDCNVQIPALNKIDPLHMCVILGNALQNAIEAMQVSNCDKPHYLNIKAIKNEEKIVIRVSNPYYGTLKFKKDGLPISNKNEIGHGFGLISIKETVNKYNGWFSVDTDNQVFCLQVVLKD